MARKQKPSFSNGNYYICLYCKNLMVFLDSGGMGSSDTYACKLQKDENGKYPNLARFEDRNDELTILQKGSADFESSGLPAHPIVLRELIKINPRTRSIPSDETSVEELYDFEDKVKRYLPKEQIVRGLDKVYNKR